MRCLQQLTLLAGLLLLLRSQLLVMLLPRLLKLPFPAQIHEKGRPRMERGLKRRKLLPLSPGRPACPLLLQLQPL
jgi:hypothetical protein